MKLKIEAKVEYDVDIDHGEYLARLFAEDRLYVGRGLCCDSARDHAIQQFEQFKQLPRPETIIIEVDDEALPSN